MGDATFLCGAHMLNMHDGTGTYIVVWVSYFCYLNVVIVSVAKSFCPIIEFVRKLMTFVILVLDWWNV